MTVYYGDRPSEPTPYRFVPWRGAGLGDGIADDLLRAGIPQNKIVLGFYLPHIRRYTEFAVN
ncbi:element excision factor XisI family protein [Roseofilum capinflatum]|uniref:element excision factor XisI family protein n=1 Tax=Roseofilum capinflatum TaxID=3082943 RepID=UPI0024BEEEA1|nr:element excision factor XisI family protein [Roseofilum capinflatum]